MAQQLLPLSARWQPPSAIAIVLAAVAVSCVPMLCVIDAAQAFDDAKYPDLKGQWLRNVPPRWDPTGKDAPLTPEYRAIFEANLDDMHKGGHGIEPSEPFGG